MLIDTSPRHPHFNGLHPNVLGIDMEPPTFNLVMGLVVFVVTVVDTY